MTPQVSRCLVVGSGSIARRHISNLKAVRPDALVGCVSASGRQLAAGETAADVTFPDLQAALAWRPAVAIVASPAPWHIAHASSMAAAGVPVLIEKPIAAELPGLASMQLLHRNSDRIDVAYNLRYLPSAVALKEFLSGGALGHIHSVIAEVGQYLPDWRPQTDYRKNVSAQRALGGGALLELSHELDYLVWLCGRIRSVYCNARNTGELEIDVEDSVDAIMTTERGITINLHMDFLQHCPHRTCKFIASHGTVTWNLIANSVTLHERGGVQTVLFQQPEYDRNEMYIAQLRHFLDVAAGKVEPKVGIDDALATLAVVDALKRSAKEQALIHMELPT